MMADVIEPEQLPLAQRFKNPKLKPGVAEFARKPYLVFYFATRDEYADTLAPIHGEEAKKSLGTYIPKKESRQFGGVSYFFNDVGGQLDVTSTLYHEASHQLLFESAGPDNYAQNVGNYWVFEGLGTYFETIRARARRLAPGRRPGRPPDRSGAEAADPGARVHPDRAIRRHGPGAVLGQNGGGDYHLHYAESMALAVFLMQADGGRYREGFLDYVHDAYKGRFRGGSGRPLEDRLGVRYPELDQDVPRLSRARAEAEIMTRGRYRLVMRDDAGPCCLVSFRLVSTNRRVTRRRKGSAP